MASALILAVAVGYQVLPANADTFNLTVAAGQPDSLPWVKVLRNDFLPSVEKRLTALGHKVVWTEAYGGTLMRLGGELDATKGGLVDVAVIIQSVSGARTEALNGSYYTPFATTNELIAAEAWADVHKKTPELAKVWANNGVEFLYDTSFGVTAAQLFLKSPASSIADLKGRKIGSAGPILTWLQGTGAVGVVLQATTMYNDLSVGIYDGVLTGVAVAGPLNLHEAGPYMLKVDFGAIGMIGGIIIGKNRWDRFPPDVKAAFNEAAKEYRAKVVAESTAVIDASMKKMIGGGLKVQELSPADRKAVADSLPNIAKGWADGVKAQGIPGDRIINDYMTAIKAREPNMARDWTIK